MLQRIQQSQTVVLLIAIASLLLSQSVSDGMMQRRYNPPRYYQTRYTPQQHPPRHNTNSQLLGKPNHIVNSPSGTSNGISPINPGIQTKPLERKSIFKPNPYVSPSSPVRPTSNSQPLGETSQSASNSLGPTQPAKTRVDVVTEYNIHPRLVAEFEPQRAIMLSVCDLKPHHQHVLKQVVEKSGGHANILILYNDNQQLKATVNLLKDVNADHVSFYQLELDTVWLRDFGPRISEDELGTRALDFYYYGVRPNDDSFPERWTLETAGKLTKIPWTLQGGNLLSNGKGLGITTGKIFEDNKVSFSNSRSNRDANNEGETLVLNDLKKFCNLKELVVLEPLRNESTKHVDMFAAFLAPDHVLVADVDSRSDNLNARVLDWNAKKLASLKVDGKPMRVDRIQIPARDGEAWSTYTNAVFTDRLVLVPTMTTDDPRYVSRAVAQYEKLLPNHHIATVDITSMKKLQGSLHCMTLNLPIFAPLPNGTISFEQAADIAGKAPDPRSSGTNQDQIAKQYSIDRQLRRVFQSSNSDYLVDAYAVGLSGDVISLLRADNKKIVRVQVTGVCDADRYWIQRNANKIQTNGRNVQRLVISGS